MAADPQFVYKVMVEQVRDPSGLVAYLPTQQNQSPVLRLSLCYMITDYHRS